MQRNAGHDVLVDFEYEEIFNVLLDCGEVAMEQFFAFYGAANEAMDETAIVAGGGSDLLIIVTEN